MHLTIYDYVVAFAILLVPVLIGVYFAWKDSKNTNREVYLLGGRQMSMLPVSLSLFVTYQSAISMLGFPSEVYVYGLMMLVICLGTGLSYVIGSFIMVPLMYPLRMTSLYEYLEMRYKSKAVRKLSTVIGMLQNFFYMIIAMLAPGLALQTAADIPFWMSVVLVGAICTIYTSIGGIKSVIWTDSFQTVIVFAGLGLIIVRGTIAVGGVGKTWSIADEGGRTFLGDINPDPRVRHTWWGLVIGGIFMWLTNVFNQSSMQRMASMKTMRSARISFLLNFPINIVYQVSCMGMGIILYAFFSLNRCDPLEEGIIANPNQLTILFVIRLFQDTPGLSGLYMATIFSGALSTLSSGINALAANTISDIFGDYVRNMSEKRVTLFTKIIVAGYGCMIIALTYLAKSLQGMITELSSSIFGACGSAVLGMFLVGSTVPWANKYGAFAGGAISLILNIWIVVGSRFYGRKAPTLPPVISDQCSTLFNNTFIVENTTSIISYDATYHNTTFIPTTSVHDGNDSSEYGFFLYDLSYTWYGLFGTVVCCFVIIIVSKLTQKKCEAKTEPKFILPFLRRYWDLEESDTRGEETETYLMKNTDC